MQGAGEGPASCLRQLPRGRRKELLRKRKELLEEGALEEGGRSLEECLNLRQRKEAGRSFVWPAV